jgi:cytochrome c
MDTMTLTKTVGAFCGSLLIFLLASWAADSLFHVGGGHGGEQAQAFTVPVDGAEEAPAEEVVEVAFADVYAAADPAAGEKVFAKCKSCHKLEAGANATGPSLHGVVGRAVQSIEGFKYSGALAATGADVWSPENLYAFLENPKAYAGGTSMSFAGLAKPADRANLIAYLDTIR